MTQKTKKILITTEQHEVTVIRRSDPGTAEAYCPFCDRHVEVVSIDAAMSLTNLRMRELAGLMESGAIHVVSAPDSRLLLCHDSLKGDLE
ncbi:MAG: hypothetical protein ACT4O9_10470 [Blastocatellia bacterium]